MHKCIALVCFTILALVALILAPSAEATLQPKAPNFQYFERPKYRYPYYDENGKGKLLYGYGGPELYQYKSFSPLDGIH
ncbi:uncharacterized protein LOC131281790 [Anopheles ziemanni]|uniref:uncharacterized protein LOC131265735 n=1 Tax=Anopheles coustani TaxID=139045 RepID=UPI00265B5BA2|nr:uncharacterized protein LOC131265735 [Anopheles coustani]XP_058167124.1 uncharacterized protein LOC131281790 [Anopheles ziemanni]